MEKIFIELKKEILKDEYIIKFCQDNNVTNEEFDRNITFLYQQKQANDICNKCLGKKSCEMDVHQMQSVLEYNHGNIERKYHKCTYLDSVNEELLDLLFFPKEFQDGEVIHSEERENILKYLKKFTQDPLNNKGVFLHGQFGTGKTFILLKTAKALTKQNINVIFAYYPDLVRHIKSCIANNKLEGVVNKLKSVDVLMLDDVGGENNTAFVRDEVLGPILQYRMFSNKPIFMTSNHDLKMLQDHFKETRDDVDRLKSDRIIERIKYLMYSIELKGNNLRNK